jgi:choline dehydrogenase-like flavoprotein
MRQSDHHADIVIVGSGMGGGTVAWALRDLGARVLLLERGDFLPKEPQNYSPEALFIENRYKTAERWHNAAGGTFKPGVHYFVGGNSKVYGAVLARLREADFGEIQHAGGRSPAWPIAYGDLEPFYAEAERLYWVHGEMGADPTDPWRSGPFPLPPMEQDPYMEELTGKFRDQGLHPAPLPVGMDWRPGGRCIRCRTCDAFPCQFDAKAEADVCAVRPAVESPTVDLWTRSFVHRILTDDSGRRAVGVEVDRQGEVVRVSADLVVLAAGAVNSAATLLRSANDRHPRGLANSSDQVGRNYMVHTNSVLVAVDPARRNPTVFQKTVTINDWYHGEPAGEFPWPMGNLQPVGKLQAAMLAGTAPGWTPRPVLSEIAARSVDWWVMSEDLPDPSNRVTLAPDGSIRVAWQPNNLAAHRALMDRSKNALRRAGYPILLDQLMGIETNSHQCGTVRMGDDPDRSVLDPFCKAHDLDNLYVVDGGFFPSSSAINPALTIAAAALRAASDIRGRFATGEAMLKAVTDV